MRPHPDHRFHTLEDGNPFAERYSDKMLATIAVNREGKWSAEDSTIATEILAYRLDYPRKMKMTERDGQFVITINGKQTAFPHNLTQDEWDYILELLNTEIECNENLTAMILAAKLTAK